MYRSAMGSKESKRVSIRNGSTNVSIRIGLTTVSVRVGEDKQEKHKVKVNRVPVHLSVVVQQII